MSDLTSQSLDLNDVPNHVAIIMDGNGRWAKEKNKTRTSGHKQGVSALRETIKAALDFNISYLSVYAFSTENWKRPQSEVSFLMSLLELMLTKELKNFLDQNIKVNILGNIEQLSVSLRKKIKTIHNKTKHCSKLTLNIMINYGSRDEIIYAIKAVKENSNLVSSDITEDLISDLLYTKDIPDPELVIRTSGEYRISNFMLWQLSYSELFFIKTFWPDFSKEEFYEILVDYQNRTRRFGGL